VKHTPFVSDSNPDERLFLFDGRILMKAKENTKFETAYENWLAFQIKNSKGERKRRLSQGLGHAEKMFLFSVWWPAFGHFNLLIPEYEVRDFKDGVRFVDFACMAGNLLFAIEIDGYGPHWRNTDRWQFADHLMRQNHLVIDGWKILRFSYDDVAEKSRRIQQVVQQAFGKWVFSGKNGRVPLTAAETGIMQWADTLDLPITPVKAAEVFGLHRKTAAKYLRALVDKGYLRPTRADSNRVMRYNLIRSE
jgi:hypothetical protein